MKAKPLGDNKYELSSGQVLTNVHGATRCHDTYCTIHNPSTHHMLHWVQAWDGEGMVRVCPHGQDHPDPDASAWGWRSAHPCDGCCDFQTPNEMLTDLKAIKRDLEP